ncbi:hypothetical protein [Aliirhizobium cellulosilyticum]|uniref:Uncharacterized protein n=1 Tax=Aliirhizobium cellulosilyticum TaxID=393664 RepID=A0A7W6XZ50_9HYPH|nr:hypothetical protein [Rhizobium cellulosilyticum]MBB4348017.1 hypothetical protein [Rhizobium cellulosilyticum]MBB4409589.1 hypothetical protein [Rhizobium cellulosilyticum]MBB4444278.1 hypothetical protein [Rhizobium cellulosilyticum]
MLTGFITWVNWSMHSNNYDHNANVAMLWDPQVWIGKSPHTTGLNVTHWAAITTGFASAFCTLGGADAIVNRGAIVSSILNAGGATWLAVASDVFVSIGLLLTAIGAGITAKAVILTDNDAITIGVARYAAATKEENLKLPAVRNLLNSSKAARRGLLAIVWGTGLQLSAIFVKPIIWLIG